MGDYISADGLQDLQDYYRKKAKERGWNYEGPIELTFKMLGELNELAQLTEVGTHYSDRDAFRPDGHSRNRLDREAIRLELADLLLYVVHFANQADIDLSKAVADKEAINEQREIDKKAESARRQQEWYDAQPKYHAEGSGKNPLRKDGLYGKAAAAADGDWYGSH